MSGQCPVCGQVLPAAINQNELQVRIQKLASPALAAEKKKMKEEFAAQLDAALEKTRHNAERQFQEKIRAVELRAKQDAQRDVKKQLLEAEKRAKDAEDRIRKEVEQTRKETENRLKKEVERNNLLATAENERKLQRLQGEREKEKIRYEAESAKLQGKLEDLSRKLEKQSGEQLGAEAEVDLFTELKYAFPEDRVERIGRGVKGADIVHEVREGTKVVGRIIYESKNTMSWQNEFIAQAKKYKTQYETPHVMVVTRVFPSKNKGLCVVRDIPVVDKRMAVALATVIREGIIEIAKLRLSGKSSDEKSQELYKYIVGDKFCTRFREMAEGVDALREQQRKERDWHENAWQVGSKIYERIEGRHREVEAQIKAIVRGSTGSETLKLAASSETWQTEVSGPRRLGRG